MNMKLYKNSKIGKIKESNIVPLSKSTINAGIGILMICGMIGFYKNISNNFISYNNLDGYSSYSEQVEALYDVDISENNEEILNDMQLNLDLVHQYYDALTDEEKCGSLEKMMETKSNLYDKALCLIKQKVAKEYGGDWNQYEIMVDINDDTYIVQRYEEKYGSKELIEVHDLDSKSIRLVSVAINLEESTYDIDHGLDSKSKRFVSDYEALIKESAKYVGKISDKAK